MASPVPIIRQATVDDWHQVVRIDDAAKSDATWRQRLQQGYDEGRLEIAVVSDQVVGYALHSQSFFGHSFIDLVYLLREHRGSGFGPLLIRQVEASCAGEKLFTSTNESNLHMRHVLEKLGYAQSGVIHNLDPGDPEIVYFKALTRPGAGPPG